MINGDRGVAFVFCFHVPPVSGKVSSPLGDDVCKSLYQKLAIHVKFGVKFCSLPNVTLSKINYEYASS